MTTTVAKKWRWRRLFVLVVGISLLVLEWFATSKPFERSVDAVSTISENATPSLTYLVEIQGTLGQLATVVRRLDAHPIERAALPGVARDTDLLLRSTRRLIRQYEQLGLYPGEFAARAELRESVAELSSSTRAVVLEPDLLVRRGHIVTAFDPALRTTNAVVRDLMRINTDHAARSARDTVAAHEVAMRNSLMLTIGLNGVLILLWVLLSRQVDRTEAERDRRIEELDAFGGRVAHDLKGPLSTILMSAQLLRKDGDLDEATVRSLERIERAGARMDGMIEGLLSFAKAGASQDLEARVGVAEVLASLQTTTAPVIEAERATFTVDVEPGLGARTTEGVLSSIVQNLVRNAVVHLGEAPVREVRVRARSLSPTELELEVADTGPGIPDDVKRRLFRPFERGSTTAAGHGLGLATVKRLVDGHGGSITLETEVGRGTTFRVRLPRAA